jgi:FMN phosphatase YigB (HAD superfamily)
MIRAIFFDFYGVWTPDKFAYFLANAELNGPEVYKDLYDQVELYHQGVLNVEQIADILRIKLGHPDITAKQFALDESSISPDIVNFIRDLHAHFLKIGILGNLGNQEYTLLKQFNEHNQMFEAIVSPLTLNLKLPLLSRDVFTRAVDGIGEVITDCLFISGNPYNLQFATSLGLPNLQFEGLPKLKQSLNQILQTNSS